MNASTFFSGAVNADFGIKDGHAALKVDYAGTEVARVNGIIDEHDPELLVRGGIALSHEVYAHLSPIGSPRGHAKHTPGLRRRAPRARSLLFKF